MHSALAQSEPLAECQLAIFEDVFLARCVSNSRGQQCDTRRFLHAAGETSGLDIGTLRALVPSKALLELIDVLDCLGAVDCEATRIKADVAVAAGAI